jgi:hypothetical protein
MHGTMAGEKRGAMFQEPTLEDFFDWLLDCRNILRAFTALRAPTHMHPF